MKPIKYIGYFDFQDSKISRNYPLACTNKMESIAEAINEAGFPVEIISTAVGTNDKFFLAKGGLIKRSDKLSARFFPTIGAPYKILRALRRILSSASFFYYLLLKVRKDEPIIVYHSLGYKRLILWAKKIKKFQMILEFEEMYHDVVDMSAKEQQMELDILSAADGYIFPTELLNKQLNIHNKPSAIILGTYHVEPQIVEKFTDGKIHVIYAGTFDPRKGGAAAAAAAAYLPDNYVFHICGFGSQSEVNMVKEAVEKINRVSPGKAIYHGTLRGTNYISLLQKCHIGLSTQNPDAKFNATSFPSKILSYMSNGLDVVTIDIPAVRDSSVGKYLYYYNDQTPQDIAHAIACVKLTKNNNRDVISELYDNFVKDIKTLLLKLSN